MSVGKNKETFRSYVGRVWVSEDLDFVDEVFVEQYLSHQSDGSVLERGPEDVRKYPIEATHAGDFGGIPATDRRVRFSGMGIFRFSGEGKVVESWDSMDQLGLLRQLGVISGS